MPLESAGLDNDVAPSDLPVGEQPVSSTLPIIESLTIESRTFTQQLGPIPVEQSQPQQQPPPDQTIPPVEPIYYQQVPPQQPQVPTQPQQPPRPITEMLETGIFLFLQVILIDSSSNCYSKVN